MSITKEKVDKVIATLENHTSNNDNIRQLLIALGNVLLQQVKFRKNITLEKFLGPIYGYLGYHKGIDNWAMLEPISRLINKHFDKDIFTFESYRQFIKKPTKGNEGEKKLLNENNEDYSIFLKPNILEKPITTTSPNFPTPSSRIPPKTNTLAETRKKNESDVDEDMLELMREARANGWGQTKPKLESVRLAPLLRQETISNLPEKEWIDAEVLTATMGLDEDTTSPYVDEIRGILSKPLTDYLEPGEKVTVGNENEIATRQLKDAAITARKRRYKEEGRSSNSKYYYKKYLKYKLKYQKLKYKLSK